MKKDKKEKKPSKITVSDWQAFRLFESAPMMIWQVFRLKKQVPLRDLILS